MQSTIDAILENMMKRRESDKVVDLIQEYCTPVPTIIVYKVLGVPNEDVEELSRDSKIRNSTSRNAAESLNTNLQSYMARLVDKRIKKPQDDLISKLIVEQMKPGNLEKEDVNTLAFLVLTAGNAALINSIGFDVLTLLRHPDRLNDLKNNPSLISQAVNEILRYHTVSALNSRCATKDDVMFGGQHIPKGTGVICSVQSADRDEEVWSEPNKFDMNRKVTVPGEMLGFGYGPHRCQAEWFSWQELEIAIDTLLKRLPNLKLAVDANEFEYTKSTMNVGITSLPVKW